MLTLRKKQRNPRKQDSSSNEEMLGFEEESMMVFGSKVACVKGCIIIHALAMKTLLNTLIHDVFSFILSLYNYSFDKATLITNAPRPN